MILIITHKQDFTADFLINKLNQTSTKYLRLNCEDLLIEPQYVISNNCRFQTKFLAIDDVRSVWFRRTQTPAWPGLSIAEKLYFNREFDSLLDNLYCSLRKKKWMSHPHRVRYAENKVLQMSLAQEIGFKVPQTIISNSKEAVKSFFRLYEDVIIKPLYGGYVPVGEGQTILFTNLITAEQKESFDSYDLTPVIFQQYISKSYEVRVTVVDRQVFAAKVDSQTSSETKIDWRRGQLKFTPYQIPVDVTEKCICLCEQLGLGFGAIDLIKDVNGEYIFLEINPNGQWAWIEMNTGLNISGSIIEYLKT